MWVLESEYVGPSLGSDRELSLNSVISESARVAMDGRAYREERQAPAALGLCKIYVVYMAVGWKTTITSFCPHA